MIPSVCRKPVDSGSNPAAITPMDSDERYTTPEEDFSSSGEDQDHESCWEEKKSKDMHSKRSEAQIDVPILTEPCQLERKSSGKELKRQRSGIISSLVDLFKGFIPGSELTKFQVPPQFNLPKSQLQVYGEAVYCCSRNLLGMCADGATPLERFLAVLRWHLSTTRPAPFAKAPYNPILGETHHVSVGGLNVLCEQVSHHPPVTALYATCESKKLEMLWSHQPVPHFHGGSVEATILGQRRLKLTEHDETYITTSPNLNIRLFPVALTEWVGTTTVHCKESGLEATVTFKQKAFFGLRGSLNKVSGKVFKTSTKQQLYDLCGSWDGVVTLKDKTSGVTTTLYDANSALADIHAPKIENLQGISPMESINVWAALTDSIVNKEWDLARDAKCLVEGRERDLRKMRAASNIVWSPKYFRSTNDGSWVWQHEGQPVAHAPLVVK